MRTLCLNLLLLTGACLTVSCTYQSDEQLDCEAPVSLRMSYVDKYGVNRLDEMIHNTDVYLFDRNDAFLGKYSYNREQSIDPGGIPLLLSPGCYKAVTWANVGKRTMVMPENPTVGLPFDAFRVVHRQAGIEYPTTDTIFYNLAPFCIEDEQPQVIPVPLRRETCYIHVILSGYTSDRTPYVTLDNLTNGYNFADQVQGSLADYRPAFLRDALTGVYRADFAILRPKASDNVQVNLYNNTQTAPIMSLDLNIPLEEQSINLETDTEPDLTIMMTILEGNRISVSVNDWHTVVDIHVEF